MVSHGFSHKNDIKWPLEGTSIHRGEAPKSRRQAPSPHSHHHRRRSRWSGWCFWPAAGGSSRRMDQKMMNFRKETMVDDALIMFKA